MTIDPSDYDIADLREATIAFGDAADPESVQPDDGLRREYSRELMRLQTAASTEKLDKPYLETLPDAYAAEATVFEWLDFLVGKTGFKRSLDAFRFYRSLGWITEDVEADLREYVTGFTTDDGNPSAELDRSDHMISLLYVARLSSMA